MTIQSLSIEPSLTPMRSLHTDNVRVRQRLDSKRGGGGGGTHYTHTLRFPIIPIH